MSMGRMLAGAIAALALALPATAQEPPKWGTITGKVIWDDGKVPANPKVDIDKDKAHCLSKGAIFKDELIVDPKTKGVKNAALWLVDIKNPAKSIPVHPAVTRALSKTVEIRSPCCVFIPRMVPVVAGQKLVAITRSRVSHNVKIDGGELGPNFSPLMPPGLRQEFGTIRPRLYGVQFSCSIHSWMKGWIIAVPNPYVTVSAADGSFTLKDVPAGRYMLMAWHEKAGWILMNPKKPKRKGQIITIKAGVKTDLGKLAFTLPKDD